MLVVLVFAIANHNITRPLEFIPVLNRDKEFLLIINQDLLTASPILPILEVETSQDRVFILLEHGNESLSPYQYQSDISIANGLPLRLARLADFENVPCTTSESNGIRLTK